MLLQDVRRKWTYACGNSNQTSSSTLNYVILVLYCYSQPDELIQILYVREVSSVDIHLRHYTIRGFHLYPENLFIPSLYYSPFLKLEMVFVLILYNWQQHVCCDVVIEHWMNQINLLYKLFICIFTLKNITYIPCVTQ